MNKPRRVATLVTPADRRATQQPGAPQPRRAARTEVPEGALIMTMLDYRRYDTAPSSRRLFAQVMWYVAATAGTFALGCSVGRDLTTGWALFCYLLSFGFLIAMNFSVRRSEGLTIGLLFGTGLLLGLALSPTLTSANADPGALWQSAAATALFMAGCGTAGYATSRVLSSLARVSSWALLALIVVGFVMIFVNLPGGDLVYAILGLLIFAVLTMVDFQRLRRTTDLQSAPLLAASIFLDAINVFLFFFRIFDRRQN
jgi:FtsH-binding integral membrane protein